VGSATWIKSRHKTRFFLAQLGIKHEFWKTEDRTGKIGKLAGDQANGYR